MNEGGMGILSNGSNSEVTDFHRLALFFLFFLSNNRNATVKGTKKWRCRACVVRLGSERWRVVIKVDTRYQKTYPGLGLRPRTAPRARGKSIFFL